MRGMLMTLGLIALGGCGPSAGQDDEPPSIEVVAASYDGSGASDPGARLAHGERLTRVLGCRGCHGPSLEGELWDDDPKEYGVTWASNLTRAVPAMSDAELRALLVSGVHPRRPEMWVMPSELFQHLSESDVTALIAYLRTVKPAGELSPAPQLGPRAREEIASGKMKPAAALVRELRNTGPIDLGPGHALARYITRTTCAECHGTRLEGVPNDTPDLITVGAYSRDEFEKLITQGVPTGGRKLKPLMVSVARNRFANLTPNERDALYAYLKARAEQPD